MSIEISDEMVEAAARALCIELMKLQGFWQTLPTPSAQQRAVDTAFAEGLPLARAALTAALPMIEEKVREEMQKRLDIAEAQVARPTYTERLGTGRGYTRVVPIRRSTP